MKEELFYRAIQIALVTAIIIWCILVIVAGAAGIVSLIRFIF